MRYVTLIFYILTGIILTIIFAESVFLGHDNWDMAAFLYLGSQLDNGNLLYINDFETKLPLVQYMFWVAYKLGGLGAWRIASIIIACFSGVLASKLIAYSLCHKINSHNIKYYTAIGFLFFVTQLYIQPAARVGQLSVVAASFMYLAIALYIKSNTEKNPYTKIILSGLCTAVGVLIRPNYIFAAPFICLLGFVYPIGENYKSVGRLMRPIAVYVAALLLFTICAFFPYLIDESKFKGLWDGLIAIYNFPKTTLTINQIVEYIKSTSFYGALGLIIFLSASSLIILRFKKITLTAEWSITVFVVTSCVALWFSFYRQHYFSHYSSMFVPYATIQVLCLTKLLEYILKQSKRRLFAMPSFSTLLLLIFCSMFIYQTYVYANMRLREMFANQKMLTFHTDNIYVDSGLYSFIEEVKRDGYTFYVPSDTTYHRIFQHPRLGDGHPAMLRNVLLGNRVGPVGNMYLYQDKFFKEPCSAIILSMKDVIIVKRDSNKVNQLVFDCMNNQKIYREMKYDNDLIEFKNQFSEKYIVYIRRSDHVEKIKK